jgi:iron complex outermembrane receptor protein
MTIMRNVYRLFGNRLVVALCCGFAAFGTLSLGGAALSQVPPADSSEAERAQRAQALRKQAYQIIDEIRALEKRPAGVTQSTAPRSEFTEQPTRHMQESLESLPGMTVRQGNGPRDFNISIRGSGANTGSR